MSTKPSSRTSSATHRVRSRAETTDASPGSNVGAAPRDAGEEAVDKHLGNTGLVLAAEAEIADAPPLMPSQAAAAAAAAVAAATQEAPSRAGASQLVDSDEDVPKAQIGAHVVAPQAQFAVPLAPSSSQPALPPMRPENVARVAALLQPKDGEARGAYLTRFSGADQARIMDAVFALDFAEFGAIERRLEEERDQEAAELHRAATAARNNSARAVPSAAALMQLPAQPQPQSRPPTPVFAPTSAAAAAMWAQVVPIAGAALAAPAGGAWGAAAGLGGGAAAGAPGAEPEVTIGAAPGPPPAPASRAAATDYDFGGADAQDPPAATPMSTIG